MVSVLYNDFYLTTYLNRDQEVFNVRELVFVTEGAIIANSYFNSQYFRSQRENR